MTLSLAYRIQTMPAATTRGVQSAPPSMRDHLAATCEIERRAILHATHLRADNVAKFYAEHDRAVWDIVDDIPNWAPPWPATFVEWAEPELWQFGHGLERRGATGQAGMFVVALPVEADSLPAMREMFAGLYRQTTGDHAQTGIAGLLDSFASAKWILTCSQWLSSFERPFCGAPVWTAIRHILSIGPDGKPLKWMTMAADPEVLNDGKAQSPLHVVGLAFSFCHCKNVGRAEATDDRGDKWHRQTKAPRLKYYVLNIEPMKEVLRREGQSESVGIKRALHICRGHFANYTDDAPLFGKYAGMFWRPDHVRGSAGAGVVAKDYGIGDIGP